MTPPTRRIPGALPLPGPDNSAHSSVTSTPEPKGTSVEQAIPGQMSLDDAPPPARVTDPPTSWAAARSLNVGKQIELVVCVVAARGDKGTTTWDAVRATGQDRGCLAKRLGDGVKRGLLRVDGVRKAPTGRWQQVYYPTASGLSFAARVMAEAS